MPECGDTRKSSLLSSKTVNAGEMKRKNKASTAIESLQEAGFIKLLQDGHKQVPVDVPRASAHAPARSQPPPTIQPPSLAYRRKCERDGRRKKANGNGDHDGSDSDHSDDQREKGHSDISLKTRKKHARPVPPSQAGPSRAEESFLTPEEEERVQNLKKLNGVPWNEELAARRQNQDTAMPNLLTMVSEAIRLGYSWNQMRHPEAMAKIRSEQQRMAQYLDDSLLAAIVDDRLNTEEEKAAEQEDLRRMVHDTEQEAAMLIKLSLEKEYGLLCIPEESTNETRYTRLEGYSGGRSRAFKLPFHCLSSQMIGSSVDAGERSQDLVRHERQCVAPRDLLQYLQKSVLLNPLVATYLDIILFGIKEEEEVDAKSFHLDELLFNSRVPGRLSTEYIEWLRKKCTPRIFDKYFQEEHRIQYAKRRNMALNEFRESHLRTKVVQMFWQSGKDVDLILFKARQPSARRSVLVTELKSMGWRFAKNWANRGPTYWRCVECTWLPNLCFAFAMDETVLGLGLKGVDAAAARGLAASIYPVPGDLAEWHWFIGENERE